MTAKASTSKEHPAPSQVSSHRGRALALQVLYETDMTNHDWHQSLSHHADAKRAAQASVVLADRLVAGVTANRDALDERLSAYAPNYPVTQLSVVDRNILRLALYELEYEVGTPVKVVISEAVELAETYGGETSPRFVNGVLGSVADDSEPESLDAQASNA
jgi:N utilization substance protein B